MAKQIKLKSLLKEGYAWERKPGKPLPTIQEVMDEYEAKQTAEEPIKEEILNENYRDPKQNLDELLKLLNKNKTKDAITLIQSVQSRLEDDDLETAFDEAVEELLDKGNRGYFYDSSGRSLS